MLCDNDPLSLGDATRLYYFVTFPYLSSLTAGSTTGSTAGAALNTLASLGTLQGLTGTSVGLNLNALTNSVSGKNECIFQYTTTRGRLWSGLLMHLLNHANVQKSFAASYGCDLFLLQVLGASMEAWEPPWPTAQQPAPWML